MFKDINNLDVNLIKSENSRKDGMIDLDNPQTLSRLVECLLFSCVTNEISGNSDITNKLYILLGQTEPCCNHEALSHWVKYEIQFSQFTDATVLFNTLAILLDKRLHEGVEL